MQIHDEALEREISRLQSNPAEQLLIFCDVKNEQSLAAAIAAINEITAQYLDEDQIVKKYSKEVKLAGLLYDELFMQGQKGKFAVLVTWLQQIGSRYRLQGNYNGSEGLKFVFIRIDEAATFEFLQDMYHLQQAIAAARPAKLDYTLPCPNMAPAGN